MMHISEDLIITKSGASNQKGTSKNPSFRRRKESNLLILNDSDIRRSDETRVFRSSRMYDTEVLDFYLHKIAATPCLPTGMILILLASGLVFRRWWLIGVALSVFWLASTPVVAGYLQYYVERGAIRIKAMDALKVDAIVVLSGAGNFSRRNAGIDLYRAGKAPLLMFTGGWVPWAADKEPEGEVSVRYALSLGLPAGGVTTTGKVMHTSEEAEAVAVRLRELDSNFKEVSPRILLVTSAAHMKRAKLLFEHEGMLVNSFPVSFLAQPQVELNPLSYVPNPGALVQTELAWRELCGQWVYQFLFLISKFQS